MANQITTSVTIISSGLKGYQALTLTNYTGSAVSAIAAGSSVEIAGAFFLFSSEESVTGFSAITTANTAYVALTPSGTAGSQIVSASWTATAPTWSESKQGWYTSTDSVIRVIGGGVKTGAAAMEPKFIFGGNRYSTDQDLRTIDSPTFSGVISQQFRSGSLVRSASRTFWQNSAITEGSLYTAMISAMPSTLGEPIMVAGGWASETFASFSIGAYAYQTTTTSIFLQGVSVNFASATGPLISMGVSQIFIRSGNGNIAAGRIALSW